jgi:hypothetical protein
VDALRELERRRIEMIVSLVEAGTAQAACRVRSALTARIRRIGAIIFASIAFRQAELFGFSPAV